MAEQAFEQRELARAEIDRPPFDRHRARRLVEHDGAGHEARARATTTVARTPAEGAEAGRQLLVRERLHEVVVGPGIEAGDAIADRVAGGEHDDREVLVGGAQPAGHLETVDVRQPDVEDDRIDPVGRIGQLERGPAVLCQLDHVAVRLEQPAQRPAESFVVLDNQQMHRRASYACVNWSWNSIVPFSSIDSTRIDSGAVMP